MPSGMAGRRGSILTSAFCGRHAAFDLCNGETSTARRFKVALRELAAAELLELDPAELLQAWPDLLRLGAEVQEWAFDDESW